jgi:hypothetical protein
MEWFRGLPQKVLHATQGRTTAFFLAFFVCGHAMALAGKLTPVYVGYMTALGGLVLGHSIKEDVMAAKNGPPTGGANADPKT